MSWWRVIERRGNGALHVDDVIVTKLVELFCCHALFYVWGNEVEHFRREPAGDAHFFDVLGIFERDVHGFASGGIQPRLYQARFGSINKTRLSA